MAAVDTQEREEQMMQIIESGGTIESEDQMTEEYKKHLVHLMLMQADSELAGGYGYAPFIIKAPNISSKLAVSNITRDEIRHAVVMYRLLKNLGVEVEEHVKQHDYTQRVDSVADLGAGRSGTDQRVNIFYYPIDSWADYVMFNFMMDRAAGHQLTDVKHCSYGPWARDIHSIEKEEIMHIGHGNTWVKRWAQDPQHHDEIQDALNRWFGRTMNVFGSPHSRRNEIYRKYRLKMRTNEETRQGFVDEVQELCDKWGLTLPEWTPPWAGKESQQADDIAKEYENFGA